MSLPPNAPQDMRDLLIRLDEKVQNGFTSVTAKLDAMDRRADGHETRIQKIEVELADRQRYKTEFHKVQEDVDDHGARLTLIETTSRVAGRIGGILWGVCGSGVLAFIGFLISLFVKGG